MKKLLCTTLIAFASLTSFAADDSADVKALQGTWIPVKAELGGKPMSAEILKTIVLKLNKKDYETTVAGEPDNGTWTIDPSAKPKAMTVNGVIGPNAGRTFPCI